MQSVNKQKLMEEIQDDLRYFSELIQQWTVSDEAERAFVCEYLGDIMVNKLRHLADMFKPL